MKNRQPHSMAITFLFCGFLLLFFLLSVFVPPRIFSDTENRYLAGRPDFSFKTLKSGEFGKKYELYLSDQFPLRNRWIELKTTVEKAQFKKEINGVYLGHDGYLIEALYKEDIDWALYEKNLDRLRLFAETQSRNLGSSHIRIMLVPSASQILTDMLPAAAAPFDQGQVTKDLAGAWGEEAFGHAGPGETDGSVLPQSLTGLLVPVQSALMASAREDPQNQLYYRTDHHWTTYGAFIGYQSWMKSIGMDPYTTDDFDIQTVSDHFYGTIQSKLNTAGVPDSIRLFLPETAPGYEVYYDGSPEPFKTLYAMEALETKDEYRVFLDGNHGWTKIVNQELQSGRRLLIVKDSYAHCFAPFASLHFDQMHMLDLRYYNGKVSDFMNEQGITDVLVLYQIPGFVKDVNISKLNR